MCGVLTCYTMPQLGRIRHGKAGHPTAQRTVSLPAVSVGRDDRGSQTLRDRQAATRQVVLRRVELASHQRARCEAAEVQRKRRRSLRAGDAGDGGASCRGGRGCPPHETEAADPTDSERTMAAKDFL